ncbi:SDR family NAD(P)-dependent oxidoreductase, partial [Myxococcus sp. 1LA]
MGRVDVVLDLSDLSAEPRHTDEDKLGKVTFLQRLIREFSALAIFHVTRGLQTFECEQPSLAGAKIAGLVKMLGAEYSHVVAKSVDLDAVPAADAGAFVELLGRELAAPRAQSEVCYRRGLRFAPELEQRRMAEGVERQPFEVHGTGVYVVTGGTRGIGLEIAEHLVSRGARRLVLMGATPLSGDSRKVERHRALERRVDALDIHIGPLDDRAALETLFARIQRERGPIRGVIHSAGAYSDIATPAFVDKRVADLERVLAPKVRGIECLSQALDGVDLDFFVAFSSLTGVVPRLARGLSDYAMANAFLDYFTAHQHQGRKRTCYRTITWVDWNETGAGARLAPEDKVRLDQALASLGMRSFTNEEGRALFEQSMRLGARSWVLLTYLNPEASWAGSNPLLAEPAVTAQGRTVVAPAPTPAVDGTGVRAAIRDALCEVLQLQLDTLDDDRSFQRYGLDSISAVQLSVCLNRRIGSDVSPREFIEHPSVSRLAEFLGAQPGVAPPQSPVPPPPTYEAEPVKARERIPVDAQPVAIVGAAGFLPGCQSLQAFWQALDAEQTLLEEIPSSRFDSRALHPDKSRSKWGGFIPDVASFDPGFFNILPAEAEAMDPRQRLLLMAVYHCLEDAGQAPEQLKGSRTGVFVGAEENEYLLHLREQGFDVASGFDHAASMVANRLSYFFDLKGPSELVNTMCSSAAVAIHRAVVALRAGEIDRAIVAAANVILRPDGFIKLSQLQQLSPSVRVQSFGRDASGHQRAEGVASVLLMPLEQAEREGHPIYAVLRGTAVNYNGRGGVSIAAPSRQSHSELIQTCYRAASVDARDVGYIEAQGMANPVADIAEWEAINDALKRLATEQGVVLASGNCRVSSLKPLTGHMESASALGALFKIIHSFRRDRVYGIAGFEAANPYLELERQPARLADRTEPWPRLGKPRLAGLHSFGAGGNNAHLLVEEYVPRPAAQPSFAGRWHVVPVSAGSIEQRRDRVARLAAELRAQPDVELASVAFTLQLGRDAMKHRVAFVAEDRGRLLHQLERYAAGEAVEGVFEGAAEKSKGPRETAAVFAGRREPEETAAAWCRGSVVDWQWPLEAKPRRLRLPVYSFKTQRLWVDAAPRQVREVAMPVTEAAPRRDATAARAETMIRETLSPFLRVPPEQLDLDAEFSELGFDSILVIKLAAALRQGHGLVVEPAAFFEYSTPAQLIQHVSAQLAREDISTPGTEGPVSRGEAAAPRSLDEPIAIIGLSGSYPQAHDLSAFWSNLERGADCIGEVPSDRWSLEAFFTADKDAAIASGKSYGKWGGFLGGLYDFDPLFFRISPREVEIIHPESRLFLQCAWHVVEDAGYTTTALASERVGVFVGASKVGVAEQHHTFFTIPNRVSYALNLKGPSIAIDTACSSSLVAIHLACQQLQSGDCTLAIAGGVNTYTHPYHFSDLSKLQMLSPEGRSKAFGAGANGFVPGEGVGAVLLKPLSRALRDGDSIHGIIRGSEINHGGKTNGFTVPNPRAQAEVITRALARAKVPARHVTYVEAHGTGTDLGDPIEIRGLTEAFAAQTQDLAFCRIGSVKTNIGHLEAAAGIAGLTKILLQGKHRKYVPSLHSSTLNPHIDFGKTPFVVQQACEDWLPRDARGQAIPRVACLSSFGAGGSNAHLIIEEAPEESMPEDARTPEDGAALFVLSARTEEQLRAYAASFVSFLERVNERDLHDLCYTLQVGREAMDCRLACHVGSVRDLRSLLRDFVDGRTSSALLTANLRKSQDEESLQGGDRERWVKGGSVDWSLLHGGKRRRRLSLPVYPFAKQRYALPSAHAVTTVAPAPLHPLVHENQSTLAGPCFVAHFTGAEPFLADHVVRGEKVLPGVAYLELAHEAVLRSLEPEERASASITLEQVVWVRPFIFSAETKSLALRLLREADESLSFRITSTGPTGEVTLHAQGRARLGPGGVNPVRADLRGALAACTKKVLNGDALYDVFRSIGIDYGPAHRVIEELAVGERQVAAKLTLAGASSVHRAAYTLPPSLLDGALQATLGLAMGQGALKTALPFSLDRLRILRPCPEKAWVLVEREARGGTNGPIVCTIRITDEDGAPCVLLEGFNARPVDNASVHVTPDEQGTLLWTQERVSEPAPEEPGPAFDHHLVLLCGMPDLAASDVVRAVRDGHGAASVACRELRSGQERVDLRYLDFARQTLERLRETVAGTKGKVLVQLAYVGQGAATSILGLAGMLKTATLENTRLSCQCIGFDGPVQPDRLAKALLENAREPGAREIEYEGLTRFVSRWQERERLSLEFGTDAGSPWRAEGVYLITGGSGGVARLLAREIAQRCARPTVVLVGRSPAKDALLAECRAWEASGARVRYRVADVADAAKMAEVVAETRREFGALNGVIHAAGVIEDNLLARKSEAELARVLAPKVSGLVALDEATRDLSLDFFVAFSSIAGALGNAGQADYAAANAFMDAYIAHRQTLVTAGQRRGVSRAINWPFWRDGGMRMDAATEEAMTLGTGLVPMPTSTAMAALYRVLEVGSPSRVLVTVGRVASMRKLVGREPAARREEAATGPDVGDLQARVEAVLLEGVSELLKVPREELDGDTKLSDYGFDSITFTEFANLLNRQLTLGLSPVVFFEFTTASALAGYLCESHGSRLMGLLGAAVPPSQPEPLSVSHTVPVEPPSREAQTTPARPHAREPIAVIGMAGRFPSADDLDVFWENLVSGKDCIREVPSSRWDWRAYDGDPIREPNKTDVKWGGFIDGIDEFDPAFFGISPREARLIDPQQRLLMMYAWKAIEDAGYAPGSLAGSNTAIYVGTGHFGYGDLIKEAGIPIEGYTSAGLVPSMGPNRLSYLLDLHGPSEPVETACSSSLVALHRAMTSLTDGTCDLAIVGGVNTIVTPDGHICFSKAGMLSRDGRCKTFSDRADGYGRGEGAGFLVLKRLSRAEADGDHIHGLILGSAENHGGHANSLTSPNPASQAEVLMAAYRKADIPMSTVGFIEAHGTGTALGDPVEVTALTSAYQTLAKTDGDGASAQPSCGIGSVKTNIGHLELAAGIAGVIKVLLQMKHATLVKSLGCEKLNPHIRLDDTPFYVVQQTAPWPRLSDKQGRALPLRAGVSSFGFGGVNAHVVLEEYVAPRQEAGSEQVTPGSPAIIVLSAKTAERLKVQAQQLRDALRQGRYQEGALARIAYTLQVGRDEMKERLAFTAESLATLERKLSAFVEGAELEPGTYRGTSGGRGTTAASAAPEEPALGLRERLAQGELGQVLDSWVRGAKVRWAELHVAGRAQRIRLPTYPFSRERHWVLDTSSPARPLLSGRVVTRAASNRRVPIVLRDPRDLEVELMDPASPKGNTVAEAPQSERPAPAAPPAVSPPPSAAATSKLREELATSLAQALYIDRAQVNAESTFVELGLDSIVGVEWIHAINKQYGLSLPVTKVYDHPNLSLFADYLARQLGPTAPPPPAAPPPVIEARTVPVAPPVVSPAPVTVKTDPTVGRTTRIAIIGMSGRYPGAENLRQYWDNLRDGVSGITELPYNRWDEATAQRFRQGRNYCRRMGALSDVESFDPLFFRMSPAEAEVTDPQHRLFWQEGYRAFEDAGYAGDALDGKRCGVYLGIMGSEYATLLQRRGAQAINTTGNSYAIAAARLAYHLNLKGPAIAIDTACSSSLVATHMACQALTGREVDMALVGGVTLYLSPESYLAMCDAGMLSVGGACRPFDNGADGFIPGEGVGAIVLKRLEDAERDQDVILGVIIGSGTNQDGKTNGITAPSAASQMELEREVYRKFDVDPATIGYVEMHGTGTKLGDPIELEALSSVFKERTDRTQFCAIGSVKSNIGHTSAAAGVASIHKVLLAMQQGALVPSLNYSEPNQHFDFQRSPFYVNTELKPWKPHAPSLRRAAISSFGFSGTNAHLVLEEYPATQQAQSRLPAAGPASVFVLSAKTPEQLAGSAAELRRFVQTLEEGALADLAFTLQVGRSTMEHRLAVVAGSAAELMRSLDGYLHGTLGKAVFVGTALGAGSAGGHSPSTDDLNVLVGVWSQSHSYAKLASAWVQGARVDWTALHGNSRPRKLRAPTYPFARERCWLPEATSEPVAAATPVLSPVAATRHSLAQRNTSTLSELRITSTFTGDESFLSEHRVDGRKVMPAAVQLEMVRAAVAELLADDVGPTRRVQLTGVVWPRALVVEAGATDVHVGLKPLPGGELAFRLYSGAGTLHCQGTVKLKPSSTPVTANRTALVRECGLESLDGETCYRRFRAAGLEHGPAYQALRRIHVGREQAVADLSLPASVARAAVSSVLPPGILDSALQACVGLGPGREDAPAALPFGLESLDVHRPCPTEAWAHITRSAASVPDSALSRFDVAIYDAQGTLCVELKGFVTRAPEASRLSSEHGREVLLFTPAWAPVTTPSGDRRLAKPERHVVFLCETGRALEVALRPHAGDTELIRLESTHERPGDRVQEYAVRLLSTLKRLLKSGPAGDVLCQLVVPAQGEQQLLCALDGLLKTAHAEEPRLKTQLIGVPEGQGAALASLLFDTAHAGHTPLRYARGGWQEQRWLEAAPRASSSPSRETVWRKGGVYLMTGGLGGLGRIFAQEIVSRAPGATLILCGRSSARQVEPKLAALRRTGAAVEYFRADVSQLEEVQRLVASIREKHGALTGVIHAAGVLRDGFLRHKSDTELSEVLEPKVLGVSNLDEASKDLPLELFIAFSSIAGALGGVGQADYATGNAYLDAFAHHRAGLAAAGQRSGRTLSINWPLWSDGGMSVDSELQDLARQRSGLASLRASEGLQAFYRALETEQPQVMVLVGEPARLREHVGQGAEAVVTAPAPSTPAPASRAGQEAVSDHLKTVFGRVLKVPRQRLHDDVSLGNYGIDSINMLQVISELERDFGPLSKTLLFEYRTLGELTAHLSETFADRLGDLFGLDSARVAPLQATVAVDAGQREADEAPGQVAREPAPRVGTGDVAIIGVAGRYPGARDLNAFWRNLRDGVDSISEVPQDRWDHAALFDTEKGRPGKTYSKWGGFIEGAAEFDPRFFNIPPKEAHYMDPQERLFLECAYSCCEDAGYTRESLAKLGGNSVGVFVGVMYQEYQLYGAQETVQGRPLSLPGNSSSIANRVSYWFDFHGPSLAVDTMCSSSLTALHLAVQSLANGDCEAALVGGVNLSVHPNKYLGLSQGRFVSSKGRCESFGAGGDGYVPAEGVGAVLLKPLERAKAEGDRIYGVIKATAVNHGGRTAGFSVPNPNAQAQVIERALRRAGVDARTVGYVEAHGTGTSLGDPVEIAGLQKAFSAFTSDKGFCAIGSVKSNIGHCESAAGIAGLTKVLLQMKHRQLVPSLHSQVLNPHIDFDGTAFVVQQRLAEWPRPVSQPRRAALSSFGAGGANAHVVFEEYLEEGGRVDSTREAHAPVVILLSATQEAALQERARQLLAWIRDPELRQGSLEDVAYTLQIGREPMVERLALVVSSFGELEAALDDFLTAGDAPPKSKGKRVWRGRAERTGQGLSDVLVDEDMQQTIDAWFAKRKFDKLLDLWLAGVAIDWNRLHAGSKPRKVSLPTYPFARERYWVPRAEPVAPLRVELPKVMNGHREAPAPVAQPPLPQVRLEPAAPTPAPQPKARIKLEPVGQPSVGNGLEARRLPLTPPVTLEAARSEADNKVRTRAGR